MAASKRSVVIIERLRSVGTALETPTLGDLRRTLPKLSELPGDAELALEISGVLDSSLVVTWDDEATPA
jgi:hypothetical protein